MTPLPPYRWRLLLGAALILLLSGCPVPDRLLFITDNHLDFSDLPADLHFKEVLFPAGNLRLYGWYIPGQPGKPLVLFCHGTATNLSRKLDNLQQLRQELGVSVFIFDYRGFGRSEGHPGVAGTHEDARAALAFLRQAGWAPERMIYFGRSLGAAVALQLALEAPPAGVVLESSFTSLLDLIGHRHPLVGAWLSWILPDYYDNLAKIGELQVPLLLIQGAEDPVVPVSMALQLFDQAPPRKTLFIIPDGHHNDPYQADATDYWNTWRRFLAQVKAVEQRKTAAALPPRR